MAEATRKQRLFAGWVVIAFGAFVLAVLPFHPENLRVPAWVAFPAMSSFVFGGCALVMGEYLFFLARRFLRRALD